MAKAFDELIDSTDDTTVLAKYYDEYMPSTVSGSTLEETLQKLSAVDINSPSTINIYAKSFDDKEKIADVITQYNETAEEDDQISYTDYVALLMSGVNTMINAVSYGLIAFVSISLVVSSIMIGIHHVYFCFGAHQRDRYSSKCWRVQEGHFQSFQRGDCNYWSDGRSDGYWRHITTQYSNQYGN